MQLPPRLGPVCMCVCVCVCVCVCTCVCVSVWNDASPCLVCDVSTHTTGQLRARQNSVCACVCVCVMGGRDGGGVSYWREKKERGGAVCEQKEVDCRESLKPVCVHA